MDEGLLTVAVCTLHRQRLALSYGSIFSGFSLFLQLFSFSLSYNLDSNRSGSAALGKTGQTNQVQRGGVKASWVLEFGVTPMSFTIPWLKL